MALDPINYLGMIQQGVGGGIGEAITSGLRTGAAIQEFRAQRNQADQAAQYAADVQAAFNSGDARAFAALSAKYPQQREAFKQSWDMLNKDQQDQEFGTGVQVWNALGSGRADVAKSLLDQHITALKNAGDDTTDLENIKRSIDADPRQARNMIGLSLSAIDPDRWGKIATEQRSAESAPFELSEKAAKAQKAAVDAKFAESKAVQDLSKGGWEIQKLANDINISQKNSKIAAINAQLNREENDIKRRELRLKLDEKIEARDAAVRAKADEAQTGADGINSISSLLGEIMGDEDSLRAASGGLGFRGLIPGTNARSMAGKIDQLRDSLAASNLDKLKGPMSDKDIEFLRRLAGNLDRYQDEDQLIKELNRLNDFLPSAMDKLNSKYGSNFTLYKNEQGVENDTGAPPPGAVQRIK